MTVNQDAVRKALADLVDGGQVTEIRETKGKVLLTLAVDVPMAEKPAFAEQVKKRVRTVDAVKDVFVSFAAPPRAAQPAAAAPPPELKVGRIVAVGAGKGGVGKSTVAVNLAVALHRKGLRVGLLDADIYGPSAALMTGTTEHRAQGDAKQRVIPAVAHGIRVVSMAFLLPKDQKAVVWRGPMVGKMVEQLLMGVAWGELDYLVVDLPPGTGDAVLSLAQKVPLSGAVVVTTPQQVALADVEKAVDMFRAVRVPVLGVVENMAGFSCPKCGEVTHVFLQGAGKRAAESGGVPLLGSLPLDPSIPPGGDEGRPIVVDKPDSVASRCFGEIADALERRLKELDETAPQFDLDWSSGA